MSPPREICGPWHVVRERPKDGDTVHDIANRPPLIETEDDGGEEFTKEDPGGRSLKEERPGQKKSANETEQRHVPPIQQFATPAERTG